MKIFLHKITAILLALLVLISTLSFTVAKHYCMGEVVSTSFFGEAKGCDMPKDDCKSYEEVIKKEDCCSDTLEVVKSNNLQLKKEVEFSASSVKLLATFVISYSKFFEDKQLKNIPFNGYSPPLITYDLQVLHDTFLI